MKMKHLKSFNEHSDYSYLDDIYSEDTLEKPRPMRKRVPKPKKTKKVNYKHKRKSKFTADDFMFSKITPNGVWEIKWNHRPGHDLIERIIDRTPHDVDYVNNKVIDIIKFMESKWSRFKDNENYTFILTKSKMKIVTILHKDLGIKSKYNRELYIGSILSEKMKDFDDNISVVLNENNTTEIYLDI